MCLETKDPTIKIADRDIEVYKCLIYPKVNLLKKILSPTKSRPYSDVWTIYPYIKNKRQPIVELKVQNIEDDFYRVHKGYHSHVNIEASCNSIFIIPKGAKYIEGFNNGDEDIPDYVSETIIYKGKL